MRIVVADDEALARARLRRLVEALPGSEVVAECGDGAEVLAAVEAHDPDVVLLDIHMPGLSGLEALKLLGDGPAVILCTAHAEHALEAFDGGAVDYVLKPVDPARLKTALDRVARRRAPGPETHGRLPIGTARGIVLVDPETITHARIEGASVVVHCASGPLFTDVTLAELERRLPEGDFLRVHRRALVGVRHLERLEPLDTGGYLAHLAGGATVEVSRAAARDLRRRWSIV